MLPRTDVMGGRIRGAATVLVVKRNAQRQAATAFEL